MLIQERNLIFKARISQHVYNISLNSLRSAVEYAILRLEIVADNDNRHLEHVLLQ